MTANAGSGAVQSGEQATSLRYSLMDLARAREDVVSLGRGDPDLDTPHGIVDAGLADFSSHGAAQSRDEELLGLSRLRDGIARRLERERGVEVDPASEIVVTNGGQEGLFLAMLALIDPGDRILCPDPRYTSYDQAIGVAGGEIVSVPTGGDLPFQLSADMLRQHREDAKLLVFVNPSNPTGACVGPSGVRELSAAAAEMGLRVISDEIYEDVVFHDEGFLSFLATDGARDRTVLLSGFSKSYAMTGFRVGYLVGPADFVRSVASIKATTSGPCPALSQYTALAALDDANDPRQRFRATYMKRRGLLLGAFDRLGIDYGPHGGGLFVWAHVGRFGVDAETFCYRLLDETGVLIFPGSSFGERWRDWVRVSLLAPEESILEAIERLGNFVASLEDQ